MMINMIHLTLSISIPPVTDRVISLIKIGDLTNRTSWSLWI